MKKKNDVSDIAVAETGFKFFCQARDWSMWKITYNPKNKKQYLGYAFDEEGSDQIFLISENGKYYRFVDIKKWEPYDYVLKKEEQNDVCN